MTTENHFNLVEPEPNQPLNPPPPPPVDPNTRRNRCQVCHEYLSSVKLSEIPKKDREKYRHKCSLKNCESYLSCPTKFLRAHRDDPAVREENEQKKKAAKEEKDREKTKKALLKRKSEGKTKNLCCVSLTPTDDILLLKNSIESEGRFFEGPTGLNEMISLARNKMNRYTSV
jgi:hypothetical protein